MQQSQNVAAAAGGGGAAGQAKQKVRARRGQATDPHSIAERVRTAILQKQFILLFVFLFSKLIFIVMSFLCFCLFLIVHRIFHYLLIKSTFCLLWVKNECGQLRRERIAERMKSLQELVPNANKVIPPPLIDFFIELVFVIKPDQILS